MGTTFGVKIPNKDEVLEVAKRSGGVRWLSDIAQMLPDDTEVIPLDNSAQGIYTIGDIRKAVEGNNV